MRALAFTLAVLAVLPSAPRAADDVRDRAERRQDKREVRQDRRALRDDARDLSRMEALLERFDRARAARDGRALFAVDEALQRELASERAETQVELASLRGRRAPFELDRKRALIAELVGLARGEIAADRREIGEDRRELREDRRESRDDRRR